VRVGVVTVGMVWALLLAGCTEVETPRGPAADSPSSPTTIQKTHPSATPSERTSASSLALRGDWEELGPEGFLELRLGMSREAALETGRIAIGRTVGQCTGFYLAMYGDGSGLGAHGYFTKGRGLSVIHGQDEMHTPRGIELGSPRVRLEASFAHLVGTERFMTAPTSDRGAYFFIIENDSVSYFGLSLQGDPCLAAWSRQRGRRLP
jgi:hypothetical protein